MVKIRNSAKKGRESPASQHGGNDNEGHDSWRDSDTVTSGVSELQFCDCWSGFWVFMPVLRSTSYLTKHGVRGLI